MMSEPRHLPDDVGVRRLTPTYGIYGIVSLTALTLRVGMQPGRWTLCVRIRSAKMKF